MPEIPLCVLCRKPIDKVKDEYVVTNKDQVKYDDKWLFAHVECQRKEAEEKAHLGRLD